MKVIPPITISESQIVSHNVPEPDAGEVEWESGGSYQIGDVRIRLTTHRKYAALAVVSGSVTPPESDPTKWADIGPTNRYAMFDYDANTATGRVGGVSVVVRPGQRFDTLAMIGVAGSSVTLTVRSGSPTGPVEFTQTQEMQTRSGIASWHDYFFDPFSIRSSVIAFLSNPIPGAYLEITVTTADPTATASIQSAVVGNSLQIGDAVYGANSDILDFSRIDRDAFGNATLVRRKNVPKFNIQAITPKSNVPFIAKVRSDYAGRPVVFAGIDTSTDAYSDVVTAIGIFRRMTVAVDYPEQSLVSIEVEGI